MEADQAAKIIKTFKWDVLRSIYGGAHSSIIGFLSTMWVGQSKDNSVLDGAPSPITGGRRLGQKNADILLCKNGSPFIVVEVETNVSKYQDKLRSLQAYLQNNMNYAGVEFGMMVMMNFCKADMKYKHNWNVIKREVEEAQVNIALVSIEKARAILDGSVLGKLRSRNDYYPWEIVKIDYWVRDESGAISEGNLLTR